MLFNNEMNYENRSLLYLLISKLLDTFVEHALAKEQKQYLMFFSILKSDPIDKICFLSLRGMKI